MSTRTPAARLLLAGGAAALALLTGCSGSVTGATETPATPKDDASQAAAKSQAAVSSNIRAGAKKVDIDRVLRLRVASGTFSEVQVTGPKGAVVKGRLSADDTRWVSRAPFQAASRYRVVGTAVDDEGRETTYEAAFKTRTLTLDEQTYPSFVPLDGQTVGVGMPAIIRFDIPVTDRAAIEKHLDVTSKPAQVGAFHWISDREVHWRPRSYWKPGTEVTVEADIGGVPAGNGIYGQEDRSMTFTVGDAMVSKVDMKALRMRVFRNGTLVKTFPITTGEQPKYTTRTGTKVIVEKFRKKRMNSETVGIDPDSADGYDLDDVEYAMRLTYTGEFVHAAPWSTGDQGRANVSHGCTGMSTADAGWLYEHSKVGDVIEYTGSDRQMTLDNGFGDWNMPFREYRAGSALS